MSTSRRYPKEVRERAVRLVFENEQDYPSQWAAITSIAARVSPPRNGSRLVSKLPIPDSNQAYWRRTSSSPKPESFPHILSGLTTVTAIAVSISTT